MGSHLIVSPPLLEPTIRQYDAVISHRTEAPGHVPLGYLEDINSHIRAVRRLGWPDQVSVADTYEEHFLICQLMLEGRAEDAVAEMINHIRKSQDLASRVTLKQIYSQRRIVRFE